MEEWETNGAAGGRHHPRPISNDRSPMNRSGSMDLSRGQRSPSISPGCSGERRSTTGSSAGGSEVVTDFWLGVLDYFRKHSYTADPTSSSSTEAHTGHTHAVDKSDKNDVSSMKSLEKKVSFALQQNEDNDTAKVKPGDDASNKKSTKWKVTNMKLQKKANKTERNLTDPMYVDQTNLQYEINAAERRRRQAEQKAEVKKNWHRGWWTRDGAG